VWLKQYNTYVIETVQYICDWNWTIPVWLKQYNTCVIETTV
jgi:hypothetical protein